MPRSSTSKNKIATTKATPRKHSNPPLVASKGKEDRSGLSSEAIAADIAAFRKDGGRIEVLGNTPFRSNVTPFRSKSSGTSEAAANRKS